MGGVAHPAGAGAGAPSVSPGCARAVALRMQAVVTLGEPLAGGRERAGRARFGRPAALPRRLRWDGERRQGSLRRSPSKTRRYCTVHGTWLHVGGVSVQACSGILWGTGARQQQRQRTPWGLLVSREALVYSCYWYT